MPEFHGRVKVKELGKLISWKAIEVTISNALITEIKGELAIEDLTVDPDGFIQFAKGIKNIIKLQTPRKVRKDKNISKKTTLVGSITALKETDFKNEKTS